MNGIGSAASAVSASLLSQSGQEIGVQASLLKKAMQSDKDLVSTLLPTPPSTSGGLDIRA